MHAHPSAWTAGALAVASGLIASASQPDQTLLVKTSVPWSVTGRDDLAQLKRLASGVGWEFEPNAETTQALRRVGIRTIRCINVDPVPGEFTPEGRFTVGAPDRLNAHLATCRARRRPDPCSLGGTARACPGRPPRRWRTRFPA